MSRVSRETLDKLQAFFDTLEPEVQSKCALCNETLVHIVKLAEVKTGAGTATVTRELAARVNEGSAPGDAVSGKALEMRVSQKETDRNLKSHNEILKITDAPELEPLTKPEQPQNTQQEQPEIKPTPKQETKQKPKQEKSDDRVTDNFKRAFEEMNDAIQTERVAGWSGMTRNTALLYANALINLIRVGE